MTTKDEHRKQLEAVIKAEFAARADDLNALREIFGERVEEIVKENRAKKIEAEWRKIAEAHGRNDIQGMKDTLWKWVLDEGIEYEVTDSEEGTQFRVTRCPFAEMAQELGAADWGFICYCEDDPPMVAGFNPEMGFRRTKTLMEGDEYCDHYYYMLKK
jgi:predicted ArsR family transcriptional regulator